MRIFDIIKRYISPSLLGGVGVGSFPLWKGVGVGIFVACCLAACTADDDTQRNDVDLSLLGTPVNFSATIVDPFITRATTYNENGVFNHYDLLYIYRQYKESNSEAFSTDPVTFHVYYYNDIIDKGLGWVPAAGKTGWDKDAPGASDADHNYAFVQKEDSYLNWDNDKTVRFRSFFRSNYAGTISSNSKSTYYPDFGISDWVSAGGPTLNIPLHITHLGSRIVFSPKLYEDNKVIEADQIEKVEICLDWQDYKRADNNDTNTHDNAETSISDAEAQRRANEVAAVYNRMCMPSGVDIDNECLYAMPTSYYSPANPDLENVEAVGNTAAHIGFGTKTPAGVISDIQRPVFTGRINTSCYLITIPYDFSNGTNSGEVLTLPSFTRFRVYMYDVNNGDKAKTTDVEKTYHILALDDLKDGANPAYPNGLRMTPGCSYRFRVGYRYNKFTVEKDDNTSWTMQDLADINGTNIPQTSLTLTYEWWISEMNNKAEAALGNGNFNPRFNIGSLEQFVSCMNLINGTYPIPTVKLENVLLDIQDPAYPDDKTKTIRVTGWYDPTHPYIDNDENKGYDWVRLNGVNKKSEYFDNNDPHKTYLFYNHYYPQDGAQHAYIKEDYLKEPVQFYDALLNKRFTINLTSNIDLEDKSYDGIGHNDDSDDDNKFMGILEGNMHTISNANMTNGYLFENVEGATITDLVIKSTHNVSLVENVKGFEKTTYITGVSLQTDCNSTSFVENVEENSGLCMVGCIHEGDAGKGLIGTAAIGSKVTMMGCMNTGRVTSGGNLCYSDLGGSLAPQPTIRDVSWGTFMCNYYNTERNPAAVAVGTTANAYRPQEYIRGAENDILKAHEDLMLPYKAAYDPKFYGYAPWRAMNAAIDYYNNMIYPPTAPTTIELPAELCNAKYIIRTTSEGFDNRYPQLTSRIDLTDPEHPIYNLITPKEGAGLDIPAATN